MRREPLFISCVIAIVGLTGCQQSASTESPKATQNASLPSLTLVVSGMS